MAELIKNFANLLTAAAILIVYAGFMWKVWPVLKENAIFKQAMNIVHQMEEIFGGGTGEIKFDKAVELLQEWANKRGWKLSVQQIVDIINAAVGTLHAEQGIIPEDVIEPEHNEDEGALGGEQMGV